MHHQTVSHYVTRDLFTFHFHGEGLDQGEGLGTSRTSSWETYSGVKELGKTLDFHQVIKM